MDGLGGLSEVLVHQEERYGGVLVGKQPGVAYTVQARAGANLYRVSEVGGTTASRFLLGSRRALDLEVQRSNGTLALRMKRPSFIVYPFLSVQSPAGRVLGSVRKCFVLVHDAYEIRDEHGRALYRILRKRWDPSSCIVQRDAIDVARIERTIQSVRRETSTTFNDYRVTFPSGATVVEKALLLSATFLIDLVHFE
jgi:hypothetical protein